MSVKKKSNSKKELDKAIDEIPGLILEEIGRKYAEEHPEEFQKNREHTQPKKQARIYQAPHRSKTWLWVGVTIFTLCIIGLWGLNISTMLYEKGNTSDPMLDRLKQSQQDFGAIISTFGEDTTQIQTTTSTQEVAGESTSAKATADKEKKDQNNLENKLKNAMDSLFATSTATSTQASTSTEEITQ